MYKKERDKFKSSLQPRFVSIGTIQMRDWKTCRMWRTSESTSL